MAVLGAMVLTNFLSNTVLMLLFYSITMSLLSDFGINMFAFKIIIGLVSCFGILTLSAAVITPLLFGSGQITVRNTLIYNIVYVLLALIGTMCFLWPLAQMIIGN